MIKQQQVHLLLYRLRNHCSLNANALFCCSHYARWWLGTRSCMITPIARDDNARHAQSSCFQQLVSSHVCQASKLQAVEHHLAKAVQCTPQYMSLLPSSACKLTLPISEGFIASFICIWGQSEQELHREQHTTTEICMQGTSSTDTTLQYTQTVV